MQIGSRMSAPYSVRIVGLISGALIAFCVAAAVRAQESDSEKEIERYRSMINDPLANPGYLNVDRGEQLWSLARGTNAKSLETCDLGEGPGKLEGAAARLPRYFKDADKVMDLEQRLLWCMEKTQGFDTAVLRKKPFGGPGYTSDMEDLVAYIGNKSNGMKISQPLVDPKEKAMFALGETLFYRRSATLDFSCSTCHAESNKRIRLQALPNFSELTKDAQISSGSWPAYRVSQSQLRTMQHRLVDCYRQMRMPAPQYASEGLTALSVFLAKMGEGAVINVPNIKR